MMIPHYGRIQASGYVCVRKRASMRCSFFIPTALASDYFGMLTLHGGIKCGIFIFTTLKDVNCKYLSKDVLTPE